MLADFFNYFALPDGRMALLVGDVSGKGVSAALLMANVQATLRARWKELAKRHHPDANGGDRSAEDRLKDINRAYTLLRHRVGPRPAEAAAAAKAPATA